MSKKCACTPDSKHALSSNIPKVYIASKRKRGVSSTNDPTPTYPPNARIISVVSAQGVNNEYRIAFSPMHIPDSRMRDQDYEKYMWPQKGAMYSRSYLCFEHYWQAMKQFEGVSPNTIRDWWLKREEHIIRSRRKSTTTKPSPGPARRYGGEGKGRRVTGSILPRVFELPGDKTPLTTKTLYQYIEARMRSYVPEYMQMITSVPHRRVTLDKLRRMARDDTTRPIVVVDFDGPRTRDGRSDIALVTSTLLKNKLLDPTFPFGHGYVVAAAIAGINPLGGATANDLTKNKIVDVG